MEKTYFGYTASQIISKTDHTLLGRTATLEQLDKVCCEALEYGAASVCIPPCFVKTARAYDGKLTVCTVIGFPNGYSTSRMKSFEARCAVEDGADEIDMVINTNYVRMGRYADALAEINEVKRACDWKTLKVIIETCLLTQSEKINAARTVSESDADYIKTSTGFSTGGATREDVALLKAYCKGKKLKAAGGIKTIRDAADFLSLGAHRLGSSSLLGMILKEENDEKL
ncbi:MAG TPA: deoxyribose-phosphate aldolase [Bacillota bacterium]|nr:deoxyribose-phosphate aldolase [Bacillota bacterium]